MTATLAQLGARTLRKCGIAIVADAARPASGPTLAAADVAARVVRGLGIIVPEELRPPSLGVVNQAEIASRALRNVGANPLTAIPTSPITVSQHDIAARALREIQVNPADIGTPGTGATLNYTYCATNALVRLGVIASDEIPTAEDQAEAEARLLNVHNELVGLDYVSWAWTAIPDYVQNAYIIMTVQMLAPSFGRQPNMEAYGQAREMVREQALSGTIAQIRAEYMVQTINDTLTAQALADWPVTAVPDAVSEAYVSMVAHRLAPMFGKPSMQDAYDRGMEQIRRVVLSGPRGQTLAVAKVYAVHDELVQAGLVSWPITAIPISQAEDYVRLTTVLLAPMYRTLTPAERQIDAQVYEAVLTRIRSAGQVADTQERALLKVQSVHDEMNALGLVPWPVSAIPSGAVDAYVTLTTALMKAENGEQTDPKLIEANYMRVRRIAMGGPAGQALAEQKVLAVHYSLDARGRTRWTLYDLPDYAEEPYVLMAATLLAPECGVQVDPTWEERAERDLMRIVSMPSLRGPVVGAYF